MHLTKPHINHHTEMINRSHDSRKPRLLFTGGGGAGSEALSRLLAPIYDVHFGDADSDAKPFSLAAEQWHRIPLATAPDFVSGVVSLCKHLDVDLVIPTVDEELLPFARGIRSQGLDVLLPPEDFVEIHLNKLTSNRFLRGKGLPVPKTEPCDGKQRVDFPCIVKPLSGRGSRNVALVNSEQELQAHILLTKMLAQDFIVQERVAGQEYTVMMTADRTGRLRAVVPVFVERKRGITLRAYTDRDEQVIAACSAIHAAFPVPGCYNIQLIKTATGKVMPFEINPRISTTTCLGLAAGVNFIDIYLRRGDLTESEPSKLLDFQDRLYLRRSWYNEFRY